MARDWERTFALWASSPSASEQARMENAVTAVTKAITADARIGSLVKVFVQGSYRNRVNVRQESDVDVGVLYTGNTYGVDYPQGFGDAQSGLTTSAYSYRAFKDSVEAALVSYLGRAAVSRGDKALDVHENSYRIDADVVPLFVHRRYRTDGSYICGVELQPDSGGRIENWPERLYDLASWPNQHYENGLAKNMATGRRYRGMVRILKSLRNEMDEAGSKEAKAVCGFFVECLAWQVSPWSLNLDTWDQRVQSSIGSLWYDTAELERCKEWGEVSELKYLFPGGSKRAEAHAFVDQAWNYIGGVRA